MKIELKLVKLSGEDVFDYKIDMLAFFKSESWSKRNVLVTESDVSTNIEIVKVLTGEARTVEVDDVVGGVLCAMAATLPFKLSTELKTLEAIGDFKAYFAGIDPRE